MIESPPKLTPIDPPPDWATLEQHVFCPLCGYNLRMLSQPRCPECGYKFTWPEVMAQLDLHPYLFEHHPEKNVRSYARTSRGAWRPRRFWSSLRPSQPFHLWRLVAWAMIGIVFLFLASASFVLASNVLRAQQAFAMGTPTGDLSVSWQGWSWNPGPPPPSVSTAVSFLLRRPTLFGDSLSLSIGLIWPLAVVVPLSWLMFTFLSLLVFRISMRRARIRPVHMLRCTIYSFDMLAWAMVLTVIGAGIPWLLTWNTINMLMPRRMYDGEPLEYLILCGVALCAVMSAYRLWKALSLYLRFDHPFATMLASQMIAALATLAVLGLCFTRIFPDLFSWCW